MDRDEAKVERELAALMRLEYPIILRQRADYLTLEIAELKLVSRGQDLEAAEKALHDSKETFFRAYLNSGLHSEIPLPGRGRQLSRLVGELGVFGGKLALVGLVALIVGVLLTGPMISALRQRLDASALARQGEGALMAAVEKLERMNPARREALLGEVRRFVRAVQPFVSELAPLLGGQAVGADPSASPPIPKPQPSEPGSGDDLPPSG